MPMYPKRLIYTTCQLPEPPDEMFNSCYSYSDINITGFSSQMIFTCNKKTIIVLPFNVSCTYKSIIFPNYWINPEIIHKEIVAEIGETVKHKNTPLVFFYYYYLCFL